MQQHQYASSARDLCAHLLSALEQHAQIVFYSGMPRSERERILREGVESLNALELLLLTHLRSVGDGLALEEEGLLVDPEEELTTVLIRASKEQQERFLQLCSAVPVLHSALVAVTANQVPPRECFQELLILGVEVTNAWGFRELLVESGWNLGFLSPVNYPPTIKVALQQASSLEERLQILSNL